MIIKLAGGTWVRSLKTMRFGTHDTDGFVHGRQSVYVCMCVLKVHCFLG